MADSRVIKFNKTGQPYDIFANTTKESPTSPMQLYIGEEKFSLEMLEQGYQALKDMRHTAEARNIIGEQGLAILKMKNIKRGSEVQKKGQQIKGIETEDVNIKLQDGDVATVKFFPDDLPFDAETNPSVVPDPKNNGQLIPDRYPQYRTIKEQRMYDLLKIKYTSCPYKLRALLATGDDDLEEDTLTDNIATPGKSRVDSFWANSRQSETGVEGDEGRSSLGNLLMDLRKELADKEYIYVSVRLSPHYIDRVKLPLNVPPISLAHYSRQALDLLASDAKYFEENGYKAANLPVAGLDYARYLSLHPRNLELAVEDINIGEHHTRTLTNAVNAFTKNITSSNIADRAIVSQVEEALKIMLIKQAAIDRYQTDPATDKQKSLAVLAECNERCKRIEKQHPNNTVLKRILKAAVGVLAAVACVIIGAAFGSAIGFMQGVPGGPLAGFTALLGLATGAKAGLDAALLGGAIIGATGTAYSMHRLFRPSKPVRDAYAITDVISTQLRISK